MGYRQVIDAFALQSLLQAPEIPDYHLMIGSAEELAPLPLMLYARANVPKQIVQGWDNLKDLSSDQVESLINNQQLEVNDLNYNLAFIGNGLGE